MVTYDGPKNPQTPAFTKTYDWIKYYLAIHALSPPSYRYAYLLWVVIGALVILFGLVGSVAGGQAHHTWISAVWHKWSIRRPSLFALFQRSPQSSKALRRAPSNVPPPPRRTRKPAWWKIKFSPSPVNGELLALFLLAVAVCLACTIGPDYIKPSISTFDLAKSRRAMSETDETIRKWAGVVRDYKIVVNPPQYTISKAWWTAGGRTGLIAFALFPLCVNAALKAPPFALFALRFPAHVYSDKLAWLHRWTGRFIYLLTVAHVALWSVQLTKDKRVGAGGGGSVWLYAFDWPRFIFGIIAFVCMSLLVGLSYPAFRRSDFELFYVLHVTLVILTLVFSSLHHPPLGPWCWSALAIWGLERAWRTYQDWRINGSFFQEKVPASHAPQGFTTPPQQRYGSRSGASTPGGLQRKPSTTSTLRSPSTVKSFFDASEGSAHFTFPPAPRHPDPNDLLASIPPGYGRADLLPGRTIRLTVRPKRPLKSAAGQYAFLVFPVLSRFTSHPFTIVESRDMRGSGREGDLEAGGALTSGHGDGSYQLLEFIIRARQGLTLDLWNHLNQTRTYSPHTGAINPAILRVRVDGSYGSAVRVKWTTYGSTLIVVGGSGVAFGLSLLGRLCESVRDETGRMRDPGLMTRMRSRGSKDGEAQGSGVDVKTTRIRFIWLVREYSHLMWCASNLRRFVQMVPPNVLQIDIFVTNFAPSLPPALRHAPDALQRIPTDGSLIPPHPKFVEKGHRDRRSPSRTSSMDSSESDSAWSSDDSIVDMSYTAGPRGSRGRRTHEARLRHVDGGAGYSGVYGDIDEDEDDLGERGNMVMALTNFDGEEDEYEPADTTLSARVKKQGQHVRRKTMVNVEVTQRPHDSVKIVPRLSTPAGPSSQRPLQGREAAGPSRASHHTSIGEEEDDVGKSVTADIVFEPTSPPGAYVPSSTPGASTSKAPSRPNSPPPLPRGAADPRIVALRHDTGSTVSIHSPLSPSYAPHDRTSAASPPPFRPLPRVPHHQHKRRLSARKSIAESLYSAHEPHSPTAESTFNTDYSDTHSLRELLSASEAHLSPMTKRDAGDGALDYLDNLTSQEREDMGYIAALARSGRPRLDKILAAEVERSSGAIAVACCGPSSLDAVVRRLVSSQVDPERVRRGDPRGYITFYNEEFSF